MHSFRHTRDELPTDEKSGTEVFDAALLESVGVKGIERMRQPLVRPLRDYPGLIL